MQDHPIDDAVLQCELLFENPFVHSSIILRKSALDVVGGYSTDRSRLAPHYQVAPERLMVYRKGPTCLSRVGPNPFQEKLVLISSEDLAHAKRAAQWQSKSP